MSTYSLTLRRDLSRQMTCQEMDENLLYLQDIANAQSNLNYSQTIGEQVNLDSSGTIVSVSIVTNGAPVQITVTGDANPTDDDGQFVVLQLFRDGSAIGNAVQAESSTINENIPYTLNFIDDVDAGEYTYTLEATAVAGGNFLFGEVGGPVITVVELVGRNWNQEVSSIVTGITGAGSIVSVNLSTSGGPVQIMVSGDANPTSGTGQWVQLQLFRDGDPIGNSIQAESSAINENIPYAINYIDDIGAGTYTYSLQVVDLAGTFDFGESDGPVITAVELFSSDNWNENNNYVNNSNNSNAKGGSDNIICCNSDESTIIGGTNNCVSYYSCKSGIFGGASNQIYCYSQRSTIIGGSQDKICDNSCRSSIIGGFRNCITNDSCNDAVIGGCCNRVYYGSCNDAIVAGYCNKINDSCQSSIIAGECNKIYYNSCQSAIIGGYDNCLVDNNEGSVILGGAYNDICSCSNYSSIIGGYDNCLHDYVEDSSIVGGCGNRLYCCSNNSTIIGGNDNRICGGGFSNYYGDPYFTCVSVQGRICDSTILGGYDNGIFDGVSRSSIIGGEESIIAGTLYLNPSGGGCCNSCNSSIIGSKRAVIISSCNSSIISSCAPSVYYSGSRISRSSQSSIIATNGYDSCICLGISSAMMASYDNSMCDVNVSAIIGGSYNDICGVTASAIIGGCNNGMYNSESSAILGGIQNAVCCSSNTTIIGGSFNETRYSCNSSIIGGYNSCISDNSINSTIVGGCYNNIINSCYSSIIGGQNLTISGLDNVVMVPSLITGTISSPSLTTWKLGSTASTVGATMKTNQYVEVEIDGVVYKLALIN